MLDIFEMTVFPITGEEKRKVYVYTPDQEGPFPVLYMFDGHNVFLDEDATYGKSWGMLEYLQDNRVPLVVVGAECNHHPETDPCGGRLSEYAPYDFRVRRFLIKGRGRLTMDWYTQELKPYIDEHYPVLTDRKHTFIAGSSMGGLMTLYALSAYNDVFSRGAALSPSLDFNKKQAMAMIRSADYGTGTVLYMSAGEKELNPRSRKTFDEACSLLLSRNVRLYSRIVPGGEHNEASWEKQIPFFMNTLFENLQED